MPDSSYYIYILTNWNHQVMYIGATNDLKRRIKEHSRKTGKGFSRKYNVNKLVYYESFTKSIEAFEREAQLKNWRRQWKDELVESMNPNWEDLRDKIPGRSPG